jgi:hypothetical protein
MRKLVLLALLVSGFSMYSYAQLGLPKLPSSLSGDLPGKIGDIVGTTSKITGEIAKVVGSFTEKEEKGVKEATSGFLGNYNKLLPKMKTDPKGFTSGLDKLMGNYDDKLKLAMGAAKFAKFLGKDGIDAAMKILKMIK